MSSILDALRKLEAEKAEARRLEAEDINEEAAVEELVGRSILRDHVTLRLTPMNVLLAGLALVVLVACATTVAVILLLDSDQPAPPAQAAVAPTAVPSAPAPPMTQRPAPAPSPLNEAWESPALLPDFGPPSRPPAPAAPAEERPTVSPSAPAPIEEAPPAPAAEPAPVPPVPMTPPAPATDPVNAPADLGTLPPLRESDRQRFGLTELRINMVRPANRHRPEASAIINLTPVFVGEMIQGTSARLIGVDMRGVAIEIQGTSQRFFVHF